MPNPQKEGSATVQGPGPLGSEGWPIPVITAPGQRVDVNIVGGGFGGAVTIADGADVAEGATTDAAVVTDINGTVSSKLRGLVKILGSVWVSAQNLLRAALIDLAGNALVLAKDTQQTVPGTDYGPIVFFRDRETAPQRYRAPACDVDGIIHSHIVAEDQTTEMAFTVHDYDTGGPVVHQTALGVVMPAAGGPTPLLQANAAQGTTGTGVPACGNLVFDGTNWQRMLCSTLSDPSSAPGIIPNVAAFVEGFEGGTNYARIRFANVFKVITNANTNAEVTVWTPAGGKKFRLMGGHIQGDVAGVYTFRDNTAGTIIDNVYLEANRTFPLEYDNGILSAAANNVLTVTGPASSHINGQVFGTEE